MRRRKRSRSKLGILFVTLIFILSTLVTIGESYGWWDDHIYIKEKITTGTWVTCIKINKTLEEGSPHKWLWGEKYNLAIKVKNNGTNYLTDVNVTDSIGEKVTPSYETIEPEKGYVTWDGNNFTWVIGDLESNETVNLSMCLRIYSIFFTYIWAEVISPQPGYITVPRVTQPGNIQGVGHYYVQHMLYSRIIKYENQEPNLGAGGLIQTDTFTINVSDGTSTVMVVTKAGSGQEGYKRSILNGEEANVLDDNNFTIELVSITDLDGDVKKYTFTVTSDGDDKTHDLSHVSFHFGRTCKININKGAKVIAEPIEEKMGWCSLEATTEGIYINNHIFYQPRPKHGQWIKVITPTLPISTPWAEDCCIIWDY